jgi:hypothetical protein
LELVAQNIDADADFMLNGEDCVIWHGDTTAEGQPVLAWTKPGRTSPSNSFTNHVLCFIFCAYDSFEALMESPPLSFKMSCGCQNCVNVGHVIACA